MCALRRRSWHYLVFSSFYLSTVPCTSPSETILLRTCRRRPLSCGYVPRARRYTGIIISSLRFHSITPTPPRTLRSSGLCTEPAMTHRCLSHLFINNPLYYAIMPLPATTPTSRNERLITVPFLRPLPTHIALPLPPRLPRRRATLRDFRSISPNRGRFGHCMSARASDLVSQFPSTLGRHGLARRGRHVDTKDCPSP